MDSSAAFLPILGSDPAPSPLVISCPIGILMNSRERGLRFLARVHGVLDATLPDRAPRSPAGAHGALGAPPRAAPWPPRALETLPLALREAHFEVRARDGELERS